MQARVPQRLETLRKRPETPEDALKWPKDDSNHDFGPPWDAKC